MCTVSFYTNDKKVIITSNRDEHIDRPSAITPQEYIYNNTLLYFPKDPKAGGSWFVVKNDHSVFVLLNGAKKKHISKPPYIKSRGIILLDIASANDFSEYWDGIDLQLIEPFTIISYVKEKLYQLRWNGTEKEFKPLDASKPKIWSSSTLYTPRITKKRETWYSDFLKKNEKQISAQDLMNFHTKTKNEDLENGLLINRTTKILTKNVTQWMLKNHQIKVSHRDLIKDSTTSIILK